ncbi:MAG: ATP phosphoribosyltransferase regulatory subunit [Erysipelotrichaceae bacterium]|nr:ATP phosphoribosyltransferase regulatory subunit [Erysipelotrichaceae bacterium]
MNQIQIPLGMKDTLLEDCVKKQELRKRIEEVFVSYGYTEIMTPTIEFYQTYQNAFHQLSDQDMFKFIDQDGQILGLRMDMTVPIARVCASKLSNSNPPYRIRYCSNVFKVRQMFAGKSSEVTDCGIECIGLDSSADLEVLCLALDTMEHFGVAGYQLEIGNSNVFKQACTEMELAEDIRLKLADLIDRKSMVELKEYLAKLSLPQEADAFFMELPLLNGSVDVLEQAYALCFSKGLKQEIQALKELYHKLEELQMNEHVSFDLGKVPHLDYYSGIIFEGFVDRVGHSVLSGGRYDHLLARFGRDLPACGFSVKLDYLLDVLQAEKKKTIRIRYPKEKEMEAYKIAKEMRKEQPVELLPATCKEIEVIR